MPCHACRLPLHRSLGVERRSSALAQRHNKKIIYTTHCTHSIRSVCLCAHVSRSWACVRKRKKKTKKCLYVHREVRKNQPLAERGFGGSRKSGCGKFRTEGWGWMCMSACVPLLLCVGHMSTFLQHFDLLAQIFRSPMQKYMGQATAHSRRLCTHAHICA